MGKTFPLELFLVFSICPIICVRKNKINESLCPDQDSMYPWCLKEKNVCGAEGVEKRRGKKRGRKVDACPKEIGI